MVLAQTTAAFIDYPSDPNPAQKAHHLSHSIPETPANETAGQSGPAASTQTTEGQPGIFCGCKYQRARSDVARQLWSAVEAGDSSQRLRLQRFT